MRILGLLHRITEGIGVLLFIAMFVGFAAQVVSRYVFNRPVVWSNDVILLAFIWWFTWAAAFVVRSRDHIAFGAVLPAKVRKVAAGIAVALSVLGFVRTLPGTVDYVRFMFGQTTGALEVPIGYIFFGFIFFNIAAPIQLVLGLREPRGEPPQEFVE